MQITMRSSQLNVTRRFLVASRTRQNLRQVSTTSATSFPTTEKKSGKSTAELNADRLREYLEKYGSQRDTVIAPDAFLTESSEPKAPLKKYIPVVTGEVPDMETIGRFLEDSHGAFDVETLDVREKAQFADWLVVCCGRTDRHVRVIADGIKDDMRRCGVLVDGDVVGIVGNESSDWKAVDVGNVVVHVMTEEARSLYDLEGLWKPDKVDEDETRGNVRT